jgi:hypothetical protein
MMVTVSHQGRGIKPWQLQIDQQGLNLKIGKADASRSFIPKIALCEHVPNLT